MAQTSLYGQDLIDMTNRNLGGYANACDTDVLLQFVNEGKDKVWAVLKAENSEYFMQTSQSTDASALNYFAVLATNTRQYALPADLREIWFIEVTDTGFENTVFVYKDINSEDFRSSRRDGTAQGATGQNLSVIPVDYFYTIMGKDQFLLAQFPAFAFHLTLYYVRYILDFDVNDSVDQVLLPYSKAIANYAAKKAMLPLMDEPMSEEWEKEWAKSLLEIVISSGPRNQANATFVDDFLG